jgi:hypothetical protein
MNAQALPHDLRMNVRGKHVAGMGVAQAVQRDAPFLEER